MGKEGRMEEEGGRGEAAGGADVPQHAVLRCIFAGSSGASAGKKSAGNFACGKYLKMIFILAKVQAHPGCALPVSVYAAGRARGAERTKTEVRLPNVFRKSGIRQRRISCRPP